MLYFDPNLGEGVKVTCLIEKHCAYALHFFSNRTQTKYDENSFFSQFPLLDIKYKIKYKMK